MKLKMDAHKKDKKSKEESQTFFDVDNWEIEYESED